MISFKKFLKSIGIINNTDQTKQLILTVSDAAVTNTSTTIVAAQTANRVFTLPDASGTPILSTGVLSPNQVVVTDNTGALVTDAVITTTELEKLDGITENVQSALNTLSTGVSAAVTGADSTGTGNAVYSGSTANTLHFKSLIAGDNVTITNTANDITINSTGGGGDLSDYFKKDGSVVATGNFDLGAFQIKDASDPTDPQDLATKAYVDAITPGTGFLKADGTVTMTGNLNAGTHSIINAADPVNPQDLATKNYVDLAVPSTGFIKADGTIPMTGNFNLDGHNILNVPVLDGTPGDSTGFGSSGIQIGGINTLSKMVFTGGTGADVAILSGDATLTPPRPGNIGLFANGGQMEFNVGSNILFSRSGPSFGVVDFSGAFQLTGIIDPTQPQHAATKNYVDSSSFLKADGTVSMTGNLNMNSHDINNVVRITGSSTGSMYFGQGGWGELQSTSDGSLSLSGGGSMTIQSGTNLNANINFATYNPIIYQSILATPLSVTYSNQFQLKHIIDGTDPNDAVSKQQLDAAAPSTYTKIPTGTTDPTTIGPALYYNTTSSSFRIYDGTTWNTLTV